MPVTNHNEQLAAAAFSRQSAIFDQLYSANEIVQYKRRRVQNHLQQYISPGKFILELNSGTGQDAIWLSQQGCRVHATDISTGMQEVLHQKIKTEALDNSISYELCSFTQLENLRQKGPYDMIFSNFAGLNCTGELNKVLASFSSLLKPGGIITLVLLPKFCLWEFLFIFKGKFKTATRRFFSGNGRTAHLENTFFKCWYYNPSYITGSLEDEFNLLGIEGLCTFVPPSYIENFAGKYRGLFEKLKKNEEAYKNRWPWKYLGDYYIISLQKKN
ncbi:MAG: class I SAM-dependent methyltransferase [Ginsengibacter sp.]